MSSYMSFRAARLPEDQEGSPDEIWQEDDSPRYDLTLGSLMVINSDYYCRSCEQEIEGGRYWAVMIETGATFDLACALTLGWQASAKEQAYLDKYPVGPYE